MLYAVWKSLSLRFWIGVGIAVAILPLGVSAVAGYLMLNHGVIESFQDVAARYRNQIEPVQRLSLLLWDAVVPVDEFVDEGKTSQAPAYRALRQQIEAGFAEAHANLSSGSDPSALFERALEDWTEADGLATEAISVQRSPGDAHGAQLMEKFHGLIAAAVDKLTAVNDTISADIRADHDAALLWYERSEWLAGLAAILSVIAILIGVYSIGRVMAVSVDRLIVGAERFADGDRDHRIEIPLPPELHRVAAEFNHMITRIRNAEEALSDLARRDGLTHLFNRRAFDETLAEAFSRMQRLGERIALLMIDIDHFKGINDTYGHSTGDDVLRAVSRTLVSDVRVFDRVFRFGGEEFAVLLFGTDVVAARTTAERLREAVAETHVPIDDGEIVVTVSIGVCTALEASEPSTLVETADAALYRAKTEGRNRVVCIDGH
jgi:diguanylate cyclase (GGDEF)-like protein